MISGGSWERVGKDGGGVGWGEGKGMNGDQEGTFGETCSREAVLLFNVTIAHT